MRSFTDFFGKFSRFKRPNEEIRVLAKKYSEEIVGVEIPFESVSFRGGVIYFRVPNVVKNEIAFRKQELLEKLRAEFPTYKIEDIH